MLKQFSIAQASIISMAIAPIVVLTAPANAATITFDYEAEVAGDAFIFPLAVAPLEESLGLPEGTLPEGDFNLDENFNGTFTGLFEREQYLDGNIDFNLITLSQLSGLDLTVLDSILSRSDVTLSGTGTIVSEQGTLPFDIGFNEVSQSIQFSFARDRANLLDGCLVGTCTAQATGIDASIFLNLSPFSRVLLTSASDLSISVRTTPRISTPEASTWLGLIGVGGLLITNRRFFK
jgi:hypothetical protein